MGDHLSGDVVERVAARRKIAETLGAACYHPAVTMEEAWSSFTGGGYRYCSDEEQAAYIASSPAPFRVGFAVGWQQAERAAR